MSRGRPRFRYDLLVQLAAFVALLLVFLMLLAELRDERPTVAAPVAPVASTPSTTAPVRSTKIELAPGHLPAPPPPPRPEGGQVVGPSSPPRIGDAGAAEKPVRAHVTLLDARGRRAAGVLVNARAKQRKLRPKRTVKDGSVILDPVGPREAPLLFTVRDARWGKQHFAARIEEREQTFRLDTPRRGALVGTLRATDGSAVPGAVIALIDSEGTITELDEDVAFAADGSFKTAIVPGEYRVRASAPGFCPSEWARATVGLTVPVAVELVVLRASTISGALVAPGSEPARRTIDIELETQSAEGPTSSMQKVRTDDRGEYALKEIRPGWYRIRACDDKHEGTWATVQVVEGVPVENCTIVLDGERREPAVEGVVRDTAETPLPQVTVWARSRRTLTDDYGRFVLRLDPTERQSALRIQKEGYDTEDLIVEVPSPGEAPKGVEVTLEPLD